MNVIEMIAVVGLIAAGTVGVQALNDGTSHGWEKVSIESRAPEVEPVRVEVVDAGDFQVLGVPFEERLPDSMRSVPTAEDGTTLDEIDWSSWQLIGCPLHGPGCYVLHVKRQP